MARKGFFTGMISSQEQLSTLKFVSKEKGSQFYVRRMKGRGWTSKWGLFRRKK